jgi:hypothetical protein
MLWTEGSVTWMPMDSTTSSVLIHRLRGTGSGRAKNSIVVRDFADLPWCTSREEV